MNHSIKKGDLVRCTTEKLCSFFRKDTMFEVYEVLGDDIFGREGYARHYTEVELVNPKPLIHQKWKDLHDKGVELEWAFDHYDSWYSIKGTRTDSNFNLSDCLYRVKDLGYDYYKAQLDKIDLSFMVDKDIAVETYGLISLAEAFVNRGAECGACNLKYPNLSRYVDITKLNKCFGLDSDNSDHCSADSYKNHDYIVLSYQELLAHPDAQMCQEVDHDDKLDSLLSTIGGYPPQTEPFINKPATPLLGEINIQPKEPEMKTNPLDLILLSIFMQEDKPKDATNANHLGILTEEDGSYVGYVYADIIEELDEVARKSENESRKLHIFSYDSTIAQKPRKIIKVERV